MQDYEQSATGISRNIESTGDALKDIIDIDELKLKLKNYIYHAEQHYENEYMDIWNYFENLYQGVRDKPEDTPSWRSNIHIPLIFQSIQDELPRQVEGLIGDGDFFSILARDKSNEDNVKSAKVMEEIVKQQMQSAKLFKHISNASLNSLKFGIGWLKLSWKYLKKKVEYYDIKEGKNVTIKKKKIVYDGPCIESPDPRMVYIQPDAESMDECPYVVEKSSITKQEMQDYPKVFNEKKEVDKFLADKEDDDPTTKYNLYTVYTSSEVYATIGTEYLVRNHLNPAKHGNLGWYPITKFAEPNKIIGKGISAVLSDYNEYINDVQNLKSDNLLIAVNKIILKKEDTTIDPIAQALQPGVVMPVEAMDDISVLDMGPVLPQAFAEIESILGLTNRVTGSIAGLTTPDGNMGELSNKTATGALILMEESQKRFGYTVNFNKENSLKPMVMDIVEINQQYLDKDNIIDIIGEEKVDELELEDKDVDIDVPYVYEVTGNTGSSGKLMDIQRIQTAMQLLASFPQIAERLNMEEIASRILHNLDLPQTFILEAPEEIEGQEPPAPDTQPTQEEGQSMQQLAELLGITPEELMQQLQSGVPVEQLVAQARANVESAPAQQASAPQVPQVPGAGGQIK